MRLDALAASILLLLPGGPWETLPAAVSALECTCECAREATCRTGCEPEASPASRPGLVLGRACCCWTPAGPRQPTPRDPERCLQREDSPPRIALPGAGWPAPEAGMPAEDWTLGQASEPRASGCPLHLRHCVLLR